MYVDVVPNVTLELVKNGRDVVCALTGMLVAPEVDSNALVETELTLDVRAGGAVVEEKRAVDANEPSMIASKYIPDDG